MMINRDDAGIKLKSETRLWIFKSSHLIERLSYRIIVDYIRIFYK